MGYHMQKVQSGAFRGREDRGQIFRNEYDGMRKTGLIFMNIRGR